MRSNPAEALAVAEPATMVATRERPYDGVVLPGLPMLLLVWPL